jgi:luciferase family oxidoreductase group 1
MIHQMIPFSVLDLSPIVEGGDASQSLRNSLDLARHAERRGYRRYWLAEHHGMPGIASAATSIVIAHVAAGTASIRVGAGGIMLPNHSPLLIAEQFGTLETLFPGRIDLALGRAPGSDAATARALRRSLNVDQDQAFPRDVLELMAYFQAADDGEGDGRMPEVRAVPGAGLRVPIWILGSSLFGAQLAAALGLPYAFASHFAPAQMMDAITIYRRQFRPSPECERPYVMLGCNVFAADTDAEARQLFTSVQQAFVNLRRGRPTRLPPPVEDFDQQLAPAERAMIEHALSCTAIGSPESVRRWLERFIARTGADELILTSQIFDHAARVHSFELVSQVHETMSFQLSSGYAESRVDG